MKVHYLAYRRNKHVLKKYFFSQKLLYERIFEWFQRFVSGYALVKIHDMRDPFYILGSAAAGLHKLIFQL